MLGSVIEEVLQLDRVGVLCVPTASFTWGFKGVQGRVLRFTVNFCGPFCTPLLIVVHQCLEWSGKMYCSFFLIDRYVQWFVRLIL